MTSDSSRPSNGGERGMTLESQRQFFTLWLEQLERFLEERDRRYSENFTARDIGVTAALAAAEKAVNAALVSSDKATGKAEQAQKEYNERSNEFRGQLDDQAKTLMPRSEALLLINTQAEKLESERTNGLTRWNDLMAQIQILREQFSVGVGAHTQTLESRQQTQWGVGTVIGLVVGGGSLIFAIIMAVVAYMASHP